MKKINLNDKLERFAEHWSPKIIGELNESYVKLVKVKGEFVWHHHDHEDELFYVIKGKLLIKFRDKDVWLEPGEMLIIPKGVEHCPVAEEEVHIMLLEPKATRNTGNTTGDLTVNKNDWI